MLIASLLDVPQRAQREGSKDVITVGSANLWLLTKPLAKAHYTGSKI
jgi:hypothetical protein